MIIPIRAKANKSTKKRTNKKQKQTKSKTNKKSQHKGGAVYTFDLNEKIGGLPARIPLNGTQDGDCPTNGALDLGFTNYGLTKGGSYKKKHKKSMRSKKFKKSKNPKRSKKSKNSKK